MTAADTPGTAPRCAGILLHPTSLPGGAGNGDLGADAHRFIEFLADAGMTMWQMLPISPTHGDLSPYQGISVHAGNPMLISLDWLKHRGWLHSAGRDDGTVTYRYARLAMAHEGFIKHASAEDRASYEQFLIRQRGWLDDYALFQSLRRVHRGKPWLEWPEELRDREPTALKQAQRALGVQVEQMCFEQFVFFMQWHELREHARSRGIHLFGDMPIFVAHDSAEVWAHREYFDLDEHGKPRVVAGVPPDYFSATGQRWGNPHYRWDRMEQDDFAWWKARLATQLELFDWIRIDHFRGFEAYWEIPADAATAVNGRWVKAPGDRLFTSLRQTFSALPLVAEDLGIITPEVEALRRKHNMPGMKILHFAFGSDALNPYLPHNHETHSVVYTGTHDNDTTCGWFAAAPESERKRVLDYLGWPQEPMPWPLIRCAFASIANLAIVPMQDVLALGSEHRMNVPGTSSGNWRWRFEWEQVSADAAPRLKHLVQLYGR